MSSEVCESYPTIQRHLRPTLRQASKEAERNLGRVRWALLFFPRIQEKKESRASRTITVWGICRLYSELLCWKKTNLSNSQFVQADTEIQAWPCSGTEGFQPELLDTLSRPPQKEVFKEGLPVWKVMYPKIWC
jgi:hypothetical protein